jgi:hypothetical protein
VRCPAHGLLYEPASSPAGCVVCRRPDAIAADADAVAAWTVVLPLFALCASAALLAHVVGGGRLAELVPSGLFGAAPEAAHTAVAAAPRPRGASAHARGGRDAREPAAQAAPSAVSAAAEADRCALLARGSASVASQHWPRGGLHGAAARGDVAVLVQDIELGLPKDERDARGRTPLAWALLAGQSASALALLEAGASARGEDEDGATPLMHAAQSGLADVVPRLLAAGARVNATNARGETPLMLAARHGRSDALAVLAAHEASLVLRCARGMTALHHAAEGSGCSQVIEQLRELGAKLDVRDEQGATAFLLAVGEGHVDVARTLDARGADQDVRDDHGLGAFDYVVRPRELDPQRTSALLATLRFLFDIKADRRLGFDTRSTPILFRAELDALWQSEGRRTLPSYAPIAAQRAVPAATDRLPAEPASIQLFSALPHRSSASLPRWVLPDPLLSYRGWTRAPNIIQQVVLREVLPDSGQRVLLTSDPADRKSWSVDDVLLIEGWNGNVVVSRTFVGNGVQVLAGGRPIPRVGPSALEFSALAIDFTPVLRTGPTVQRYVLSALDYGGDAALSAIHLLVEGPGAHETAKRIEVERVTPKATPP